MQQQGKLDPVSQGNDETQAGKKISGELVVTCGNSSETLRDKRQVVSLLGQRKYCKINSLFHQTTKPILATLKGLFRSLSNLARLGSTPMFTLISGPASVSVADMRDAPETATWNECVSKLGTSVASVKGS
jgi:hypothetical protein